MSYAYNFESTAKIPIKISIDKEILSEKDVYEGQIINFRAVNTVQYNNRTIIKRGDIVSARVKVVISSGMNGIPASIILIILKYTGFYLLNWMRLKKFSDKIEVYGYFL